MNLYFQYPSQSSNPMSMPPDSVNKRYTESYSDQINHVNNQMNMMPAPQVGCNKLWVNNKKNIYLKQFFILHKNYRHI